MIAIDREKALSHPFANGKYDKKHANLDFILGFESYKEWLESLPTIEAKEVVHGKWIIDEEGHVHCHVCGTRAVLDVKRKYCSTCGAMMDEGEIKWMDKGQTDGNDRNN